MKLFILLIAMTLSLSCCNNDDDTPVNPIDQLPPATQTGENTFGCLVNGEPFYVTNTYNQVAIYQGGSISIGGVKNINQFFSEISIFISESAIGEEITENEIYILQNNSTMKGQYYREDVNCFYNTNQTNTGFIKLTKLDTINYIVSGEFEFQVFSENCQETFSITNGRFDMHYIP